MRKANSKTRYAFKRPYSTRLQLLEDVQLLTQCDNSHADVKFSFSASNIITASALPVDVLAGVGGGGDGGGGGGGKGLGGLGGGPGGCAIPLSSTSSKPVRRFKAASASAAPERD